MLTTPSEKNALLEQFNPRRDSWIVSDLKTKLFLQKKMLQRRQVLPDTAVLRASEFWRRLLWQTSPEWRVIKPEVMLRILESELPQVKSQVLEVLLTQMEQLLPLVASPMAEEMLPEWLNDNPEAILRWGHWFEYGRLAWDAAIKQKILVSAWVPAYLSNQENLEGIGLLLKGKTFVDLSAQLSTLEADNFLRLAKSSHIEILAPLSAGAWEQDPLRAYSKFKSFVKEKDQSGLPDLYDTMSCRRFTTPLAESKDAVATVRQWLEQGVAPEKIALLSPEIESYWVILQPFLQEEGVPCAKDMVTRLHCFPDIHRWLAFLKIKQDQFTSAELELVSFSQDHPPLAYDQFVSMFANIYSSDQVARVKEVAGHLQEGLDPFQVLHRDEFLLWALRWWQGSDATNVEILLKDLVQSCPESIALLPRAWLKILETMAAQREISLLPGHAQGVQVVSILSADWLDCTHVYFLGLNAETLRSLNSYGLSPSDVERLHSDLGFVLPQSENERLEFESRWLLKKNFSQAVLSCADVDINGNPLTLSQFWSEVSLGLNGKIPTLQSPAMARRDHLQNATLEKMAELRQWSQVRRENLFKALACDVGEQMSEPFAVGQVAKLSASALERYADCPFKYAAERVFHLTDLPEEDLDMDGRTRGRLLHKIFEHLTAEPRRFDWSDNELNELFDQCRELSPVIHERLWQGQKQKIKILAQRFLEFEKAWCEEFPQSKTLGRELFFKALWDQEQKKLVAVSEANSHTIPLSGVVDRVDGDGTEYVVLDYKTSLKDLMGPDRWLKEDSFQLLIYEQAVTRGFTELPSKPVRGAFYYGANPINRNKGIRLEGETNLLRKVRKTPSVLSAEKYKDLIEGLFTRLDQLITGMQNGKFLPQPKDKKNCGECKWKSLCRAPHLH